MTAISTTTANERLSHLVLYNPGTRVEVEAVSHPCGPTINLVLRCSEKGNDESPQLQNHFVLSMDEKGALDLIHKVARELEVLRSELAAKWMTY